MEQNRFDINLFDPSVVENPYPLYEQIRSAGRVVWNDSIQAWMVPGFDDCSSVLTDMDTYREMSGENPTMEGDTGLNLIVVDNEDHHRLRSPLVPLFTRSASAKWEPRVREVVDELLNPLVEGAESFDIIADFTMIPTVIVAEMLGVPKERHEDFRRWSHTISSNIGFGHESEEQRAILVQAATELNDYIREEIERHRREPLDDVISTMLTFTDEGREVMSIADILSTAFILLSAAYDTTAKLMSNSLVTLAQHPDQRRLLVEDQALIPAAIEEIMRWCGVTHLIPRRVSRDTELAGTNLKARDQVYAMVAAANRDPSRWPDADRFDVRRDLKSHVGFGWGPHLCLGAPLARIEARVGIERLLSLAPEFGLRNVVYGPSLFIRGPEHGTLDVTAGAPA